MTVQIIHGDCRSAIEFMPSNSIHSIVTDPPYALVSISKRFSKSGRTDTTTSKSDAHQRFARGFMGKTWDNGSTAFDPAFWFEAMRVLRPGGHVLAFGGTRTYHRLACAIEDAGFEIRDQIGWLYGSGFPKSHNQDDEWEGWGTALKPAQEPIVVARKALDGTVAQNLARWGVGALNIDGCRVGWPGGKAPQIGTPEWGGPNKKSTAVPGQDGDTVERIGPSELGRWPANVIHDGSDEVLGAFPNAKGQQGYVGPEHGDKLSINTYGDFGARPPTPPRGDSGSAARFFYCAKASRADRNDGLEDPGPQFKHGATLRKIENTETKGNTHPTVKPTELMRYLCRLVTPPGGTVLDPFMGSGSTGRGAVLEGFNFIGCEMEAEYAAIAKARIAAVQQPAPEPEKLAGVFA